MSSGGYRPGAGRPKGSRNARTLDRERRIQEAAEVLDSILPDAFKGDAHSYLMAVYKDPSVSTKERLTAAIAAIGYEKPRLAAVAQNGKMTLTHEQALAELEAADAVTRIELIAVSPSSQSDIARADAFEKIEG